MKKSLVILSTTLFLIGAIAKITNAQNVAISDEMTISTNAGEAQSTVVPPGLKKQCEQGRFLVTNDLRHPPSGVVMGRNLDQTSGTTIQSTFNMGILAKNYDRENLTKSNYSFGTNDHDLLTLSNGDVLYLTGAFTRMPLVPSGARPLPSYMNSLFANAYRQGACAKLSPDDKCLAKTLDFGPNARTDVLVWRSSDCGETFDYVGEMDPTRFGGGTCALPQFRVKPDCKGDCRIFQPHWDMGGTDGQLARVDPKDDKVYLTFQCKGYNADDPAKADPVLDPNKPLNQTLVLIFDPSNNSWKSLGYIKEAAWRFGIVPFPNELDFGFSNSVLTGKKTAQGTYVFDSSGSPAPNGTWSWMGTWNFKDSAGNSNVPIDLIGSNVLAVPVISRTPDASSVMLAFPDNFGAKGWGYRVTFYDRVTGKVSDGSYSDAILPSNPNSNNVVFHLTVVDPGKGPVLIYWTDLDSASKKITIRGRLITGGSTFTDDFAISQKAGAPASFLMTGLGYWYGDYHTAGGYVSTSKQTLGQGPATVTLATTSRYDFYPMWVEAGAKLRYAKVEYAVSTDVLSRMSTFKRLKLHEQTIPPECWKPRPDPLNLSRIRHQVRPISREPDHY